MRSSGGRLVVVLGQLRAPPHHLPERPERDALAVGRRPAAVPVDVLRDAVDVLLELPHQPALADAARPGDRDEPHPPVAADGVEHLLELAQLLVAADERRLERVRAALAAACGHHPNGLPRGDGRCLALERVVADRLEHDGALRRPSRRLSDEHGPRLRDALQARGRVDEVAGHHALVLRVERDRGLAGQDAGSGLEVRAQGGDRVDQLERRPDRAFRVVLVGDRRSPDGHDRVADELLDRPPVQLHDRGGRVEVAAQQLAHGLGVAVLGEGREADEVGEHDGDQAALSGRR